MSLFEFDQLVTVDRVLSRFEGGCIFSGIAEDGQPVRIKFTGKGIEPLADDVFKVQGQMESYLDRWGRQTPQVHTKLMRRHVLPGGLLAPWLRRLPNIGLTRANRLIEAFGHALPDVLRDVTRISEVAAIIEPTKRSLAARIAAQVYAGMAVRSRVDQVRVEEVEFLILLEKAGINESRTAASIWRFMAGPEAIQRLLRNPYVPAHLMDWPVADHVGQRLLRERGEVGDLRIHPARLLGGLASVWRQLIREGDSAAPDAKVRALLETRGIDPVRALAHADRLGLLRRAGDLLRAPGGAWIEDQVIASIRAMENAAPTLHVPDLETLNRRIDDAEVASNALPLTAEQRSALVKLIRLPFAVLQGGAGTGKTTVMRVMSYVWESLGGDVVMGALAGKAALQLSRCASSPGAPRLAHTLARLVGMLERQQACEQASNGKSRRLDGDVTFTSKTLFIIDEAGMVDTPTLHQLLRLLPEGVRVLMAGDDGQLFPIGFGKIFHDIVEEGSRVAGLTKVLRQAEDSIIPLVAAQVRSGKIPRIPMWNGEAKGVYRIAAGQRQSVQRDLLARDDVLVLAARRATVSGVNDTESQARRVHDTVVRRLGPLATVACGDRIVVTANRYHLGLFNGQIGVVTEIDGQDITVLLDGEDQPRQLSEEAQADVELAYCITCHKAQGSSADTVLIIVENSRLVSREWLYTAFTRARNLVLLAEETPGVIEQAIRRRTIRTTGFAIGSSQAVMVEQAQPSSAIAQP
jgi:exodeoxyribonuclease V alpha subunit